MKQIKKIPLKWQFTILSGSLILITSLTLNLVSVNNAKKNIGLLAVENTGIVQSFFRLNTDLIPENSMQEKEIFPIIQATDSIYRLDLIGEASAINFNPIYTQMSSKATEAKTKFNYTNYIFTAIIASIGMIITYLISNKLLSPINDLSTMIASISEHNQNNRLPLNKSTDEISKLTKAFNKMMDELDGSYDKQKQFSTSIAHELKTPLATLKASVQTLSLEGSPSVEECKTIMQIADKNIERLINVVDDLFLLTSAQEISDQEIISVESNLKQISNELDVIYKHKDIKLTYDFEEAEHFIKSNETLFYRLFYNLVENAFKYSNEGSCIILTSKASIDGLHVLIRDHGIGIRAKDLSNIYDVFYCVDKSRSRKLGGAGLGLAIVKSIVEKQGWDIKVSSVVNSWTTFEVLIPCFEELPTDEDLLIE